MKKFKFATRCKVVKIKPGGYMKKILITILSTVFLLSGCATANKFTKVYDNTYDYDKLYHATLLTLNSMNYTVSDENMTSGNIDSMNRSMLFTASSLGVCGIIPCVYSVIDYPRLSITMAKGKSGIFYYVTESTSDSLLSTVSDLINNVEKTYSLMGEAVSVENKSKVLNAKISPSGTSVKNEDSMPWENTVISIFVKYHDTITEFKADFGTIPPGETINLDYGKFAGPKGEKIPPMAVPENIIVKGNLLDYKNEIHAPQGMR